MSKKKVEVSEEDVQKAPTTGNIEGEGDIAVGPTGLEVNGQTNAQEFSDEEKAELEKKLSKDGIVARVITWSGKYLKVKYFKDNKPFSLYKGKNGSVEEAEKARDEAIKTDKEVNS